MKKLIIQAIAIAAVLLPLHQAEAATFGGFRKGLKFKLKVEEVVITQQVGFGMPQRVNKVPAGVPKYRKNQSIRFKIGNRGELIAKGTKIPFQSDGGTSNVYNKVTTGAKPKTDTGIVYKDSNNKPLGAALTFIRISGSPFSLKTQTVTYTLN